MKKTIVTLFIISFAAGYFLSDASYKTKELNKSTEHTSSPTLKYVDKKEEDRTTNVNYIGKPTVTFTNVITIEVNEYLDLIIDPSVTTYLLKTFPMNVKSNRSITIYEKPAGHFNALTLIRHH